MSRRILEETTKSTFASDDYLYMDGQTDGSSKITPDNLVRNTTVAQQLAQHIADAEDEVEQITDDIEGIQSDINDVKGDIGDLEDLETEDKSSLVNAINEARGTGGSGSGLTADIKTALLQIAQKVAYIDEHGQDYYDDLYDALYAITAITLNTTSISLQSIGATSQLTATTTPSGGNVTWSSSNTSVATVSATGLVTSVAYGSATITATAGNVSATCSVVVAQATCTGITATYTPSGKVYDTDTLDSLKSDLVVRASWSNGTISILTDSEYSLSGTLATGTSTITASFGGQTDTFDVTVVGLVSITATYTQSGTVYNDASLDDLKTDLVVTANYSDSSSEAVTTYTLSGTLAVGTSTITVTYGEKTATFTVEVSKVDNSLYNWDFTQSLVDSKQSVEAVLGTTASRDSNGLTFSGTDVARFVDLGSYNQVTIEADVTSFTRLDRTDIPCSVFGFALSSNMSGNIGAIHRYGIWKFNTYAGNVSDNDITQETGYDDVSFFNGKTMKLQWDVINQVAKLYADNALVIQTSAAQTGWNSRGWLCGGSNAKSCTITGLRVYEGLV